MFSEIDQAFKGSRVTHRTAATFDQVVARFHDQVAPSSIDAIVRLAEEARDEAQYGEAIAGLVGESGFLLFSEIDHGSWIARFGLNQRAVRLIFGNPVVAITMIREDINAGLFVPVELLVVEWIATRTTTLTYVMPSSMIVLDRMNVALRTAAEALDLKIRDLIAAITRD